MTTEDKPQTSCRPGRSRPTRDLAHRAWLAHAGPSMRPCRAARMARRANP